MGCRKVWYEMKAIWKSISELRKKRGFTQKELADKVYLFPKTIGGYEEGIIYPSKQTVQAIAKALDVKPIALFTDDTDKAIEELLSGLDDICKEAATSILDVASGDIEPIYMIRRLKYAMQGE